MKVILPVVLIGSGVGLSVLFIYLFAEIAEDMLEKEIEVFDSAVIGFFDRIQNESLSQFLFFMTELGSLWFLSLFSIAVIMTLWLKKRDKWGILFFIMGIGGGGLLTKVLKFYYERSRPSINEEIDAIGYSFPSGHSMGSFVFYGFIAYFIIRSKKSRAIKWIVTLTAGMFIVLIGTSRIYLAAHYPSDVIAGHLAGAIWLILCILALEWVQWRNHTSIRPMKSVRKFLSQMFKRLNQL